MFLNPTSGPTVSFLDQVLVPYCYSSCSCSCWGDCNRKSRMLRSF